MDIKNAWIKYKGNEREKVMNFAEGYKNFLSACKTERECVDRIIEEAREQGYLDLEEVIRRGHLSNPGTRYMPITWGKPWRCFRLGKNLWRTACGFWELILILPDWI